MLQHLNESALLHQCFPDYVRKTGEKKLKIVEGAVQLLAAHGPGEVGFESLGKHVGMTRAHVRYHYASIELILLDALKLVVYSGQIATLRRVELARTDRGRLLAVGLGALDWASQCPDQVGAMISLFAVFERNQNLRKQYSQMRLVGQQRIAHVFQRLLPSLSPEEALVRAELYQDLITGILTSERIVHGGLDYTRALKKLLIATRSLSLRTHS